MPAAAREWFRALFDTAPDVYFRYALAPRGFTYISPSVHALVGRTPAEFYANANLCVELVASDDRRLLRRVLAARRGVTLTLHLVRDGILIPVEVRIVSLVRRRRVVAIEGVARLAAARLPASAGKGRGQAEAEEPVQQRLAALMFEVHDLLHRVLPATDRSGAAASNVLRLGDLALDTDRLTVTESGQPVALTAREVLLLRYLLQRTDRIVTRQQLLTDVWSYHYTGDDRTVDVHISRLRRKLPSLQGRLIAIRGIGYRLDVETEARLRA